MEECMASKSRVLWENAYSFMRYYRGIANATITMEDDLGIISALHCSYCDREIRFVQVRDNYRDNDPVWEWGCIL